MVCSHRCLLQGRQRGPGGRIRPCVSSQTNRPACARRFQCGPPPSPSPPRAQHSQRLQHVLVRHLQQLLRQLGRHVRLACRVGEGGRCKVAQAGCSGCTLGAALISRTASQHLSCAHQCRRSASSSQTPPSGCWGWGWWWRPSRGSGLQGRGAQRSRRPTFSTWKNSSRS